MKTILQMKVNDVVTDGCGNYAKVCWHCILECLFYSGINPSGLNVIDAEVVADYRDRIKH